MKFSVWNDWWQNVRNQNNKISIARQRTGNSENKTPNSNDELNP